MENTILHSGISYFSLRKKLFFIMENVISQNGKKAMFHCGEMLFSIMEKTTFHYGNCYYGKSYFSL